LPERGTLAHSILYELRAPQKNRIADKIGAKAHVIIALNASKELFVDVA
jgi:hypothetical protein